jgi:hypothetical protein
LLNSCAAAAAAAAAACLASLQGGLTWLWLDAPYVITARKLFNWAVQENDKGNPFPVSDRQYLFCDHVIQPQLWMSVFSSH